MDSDSPVKDLLYEQIGLITEDKIQLEISKNNSKEIIQEIISKCQDKILATPGNTDENFGIFAESLLHYLLTLALIPSHRKITLEGSELDIVIPDLQTVNKNPENALIICFPKSENIEVVKNGVSIAHKFVPEQNIFVILHTNLEINEKKFLIGSEQNSFTNILDEISEFLSKRKQTKFKIFKT